MALLGPVVVFPLLHLSKAPPRPPGEGLAAEALAKEGRGEGFALARQLLRGDSLTPAPLPEGEGIRP